MKKPKLIASNFRPKMNISMPNSRNSKLRSTSYRKRGASQASLLAPLANHDALSGNLPLVDCLQPEDWDEPVANHHYSLGQISGALSLVLDCRGSLRGSALTTGLISRLLGEQQEVPSPTSVRSWLLRVGLHQILRPL
jgi:hypothetical protein